MKKAIQFGAGNIGRGFIGTLLAKSGYHVVFADVRDDIIEKINSYKSYIVKTMDIICTEEKISNISGVNSNDKNILEVMKDCEIITTSVGLTILPKIAPTIAQLISHKSQENNCTFVNIIACENAIKASSQLKEYIYDLLNQSEKEFADKYIGFPNCSVDRIVPPVTSENIVDVVVENYYEWNVERSEFKGEIPKIEGLILVDDLMAFIERKLFTLNTGHAITAYLGFIKNLDTIELSIKDPKIYDIVRNAMIESGNGLIKKYSFDKDTHIKYIDKIINRFKNPHLKDDVLRVGREPIRKLSPNDRLINPTMTAHSYGFKIDNLVIGIACALHYNNNEDNQSVELQKMIEEIGVLDTITEITKIKDESILNKIKSTYDEISNII